ncbi:MAG: hypothetical protein AAF806_28515 [Bacteroidota bacterium]
MFLVNIDPIPTSVGNISQGNNLSKVIDPKDIDAMKMRSSFSVICKIERIRDILETELQQGATTIRCAGIRLYPANENFDRTTSPIPSFLAIAVDENGRDMVPDDQNALPCHIFKTDGEVKKVTIQTSIDMINKMRPNFNSGTVFSPFSSSVGSILDDDNNVVVTSRDYFKATFTRQTIESVMTSGAINVRFDVVHLNEKGLARTLKTLAASPADSNGNIIGNDNSQLSLLPCPPSCHGGAYID